MDKWEAAWTDHAMELELAHNSGYCKMCEDCLACFTHEEECTCTKEVEVKTTTELEDALCQWTNQIIAIAKDIHASQMRSDYTEETGTRHFANLLKFNIERINELSEQLSRL